MTGAVLETSASFYQMTRLIAQEDVINNDHRENFIFNKQNNKLSPALLRESKSRGHMVGYPWSGPHPIESGTQQ